MRKNLVLLGMMGVGKTTSAKIVASKLKLKFVDTDSIIEEKNKMSISQIFKVKGENFFREDEERIVLNSLDKNNSVISIGGGAFINEKIREKILKQSISIWLELDIKTLSKRLIKNIKRPLLNNENNEKKLIEIYTKRKSIYNLANYKIVCDKLSKENITKKIIQIYENQ